MNLSDIKKIDWQKIEDNRKISLYPVLAPGWTAIIDRSKKVIGKKQNYILCEFIGHNGTFYGSHKEWDAIGRFILQRILKNPSWGFYVDQQIISRSHKLLNFSGNLTKINLKRKTSKELIDLYQKYNEFHSALYHYAIIPVFLDLYQPILSDYLMNYLENKKLKAFNDSEVFGILTTPDKSSQVQKEEIDLMNLALKIRKNPRDITQAIQKHHQKYCYQGYNWEGPVFPVSYFLKRLKEFVANKTIAEEIKLKKDYHQKIKQKQQQYSRAINLDRKRQKLFILTRDFVYSKDYRKDALVKSYWQLEPLLDELAKRLNLNFREVRSLTISELRELSDGKKMTREQKSRLKAAVFVAINGKTPGQILTGNLAKQVIKYIARKEKVTAQNEISGQVAYPEKSEEESGSLSTLRIF